MSPHKKKTTTECPSPPSYPGRRSLLAAAERLSCAPHPSRGFGPFVDLGPNSRFYRNIYVYISLVAPKYETPLM